MKRTIVSLMIGLALGAVVPVHAVTTTSSNLTVGQRLTRLENEVAVLKHKASKLTNTGHYKGTVDGSQVTPFQNTYANCSGNVASWYYDSYGSGKVGISC
jgi:hypothetical protein